MIKLFSIIMLVCGSLFASEDPDSQKTDLPVFEEPTQQEGTQNLYEQKSSQSSDDTVTDDSQEEANAQGSPLVRTEQQRIPPRTYSPLFGWAINPPPNS